MQCKGDHPIHTDTFLVTAICIVSWDTYEESYVTELAGNITHWKGVWAWLVLQLAM